MTSRKINENNNVDYYIGCGCYQFIHFILLVFINFVNAFNMAMMVFGKVEPKWICLDWGDERQNMSNLTNKQFYTCKRLNELTCKNFTMTSDFYSVATEFELICGSQKIIFMSMSIQMVGVLVASPIFGQLSDWYGRKWVLFGTTIAQVLVGTASAWSPNMTAFIVFRFFIGIFAGGSLVSSHIYFVEFLTAKHRFWMSAACSWSICYAFFSIIAWLTADWRMFTIIGNLLGVPGLVMLCFLPESPRWLIQRGKIDRAEKSLLFISKFNKKRSDPKNLELLLENLEHSRENSVKSKQRHYSFWHLFATLDLTKHTIVLCFCYFAISTISYGIVYDSSSLVGNRYLNFFVFAILRYVISFLSILADVFIKSCGRKAIFCFCFSVIFICCTTVGILKLIGLSGTIAVSTIAILAGIMTAPVWNALGMSSSELFPTPIRNVGAGFNAVFNRLGLVLSPQILYVAYFWPPASYIVFASLAAIVIALNLIFIPETKGKPLPENMPTTQEKKSSLLSKGHRSSTIRSDSFTVYNFTDLEDETIQQN